MRKLFSTLCAVALLAALSNLAPAADRGIKVKQVIGEDTPIPSYHALVIGVNRYKHWQSLRQARGDAEEIAKLLLSKYGFKTVRTVYDEQVTLVRIQKELRDFAKLLTPDDALLIYYAGHGYYDPLLKKGYWVPSDAPEKVDGNPAISAWFHNTTLKEYLDAMKARQVLVVSDSCFSGAMLRGSRVDIEAKENAWYRRAISQPCRWAVASGDLETVPDQSVFAKKFLDALQYPRQPVFSASDLAGWIKNEVSAQTGRRPVFGPMDTSSGSELGEFVFLTTDGAATAGGAGGGTISATPPPVAPATPAVVAPATPSVVIRYGSLMITAPMDGVVSIDSGQPYVITAGRGLKWDQVEVGQHTVAVLAGGQTWASRVLVQEGRLTAVEAFPRGQSPVKPPAPPPAATFKPKSTTQSSDTYTGRTAPATQRIVPLAEQDETKKHRPRAH